MAKSRYEPCSDCSSGDETLFGESTQERDRYTELFRESCFIGPSRDDLSGESMPGRPTDKILSEESRSDDSKSQSWGNVSETATNSDASEVAIHSLLLE